MRLIDADQFGVISLQGKSEEFIEGVRFIFEKIDEAPTVEERPRGKWQAILEICMCSLCKQTFEYLPIRNFCPNCGARMVGVNEK